MFNIFKYRSDRWNMCTMQLPWGTYPYLKLETMLKQLLGFLPLDIALPGLNRDSWWLSVINIASVCDFSDHCYKSLFYLWQIKLGRLSVTTLFSLTWCLWQSLSLTDKHMKTHLHLPCFFNLIFLMKDLNIFGSGFSSTVCKLKYFNQALISLISAFI